MLDIAKSYAQVLGIVLTIVGILGFIPGITTHAPNGDLLGLFAVNGTHNIVHLLSGLIGIAAGFSPNRNHAKLYALVFGIVYGIVTIIGLIQGNTVLGLIPVNIADNILHIVITVASLAVYFISSGDVSRMRDQAALNR